MKNGREGTRDCARHAVEAGEFLDLITGAVEEISKMNEGIATAVKEQYIVTEEVTRSISNIKDIAEQSANGVNMTKSAGDEMTELANRLNRLVGRFKV